MQQHLSPAGLARLTFESNSQCHGRSWWHLVQTNLWWDAKLATDSRQILVLTLAAPQGSMSTLCKRSAEKHCFKAEQMLLNLLGEFVTPFKCSLLFDHPVLNKLFSMYLGDSLCLR